MKHYTPLRKDLGIGRFMTVTALMLLFAVNAYSYQHAELSVPTDITVGGAKFTSSIPEGAINPRLQLALGNHVNNSEVTSPYSDYVDIGFSRDPWGHTNWSDCTALEGGGVKTDKTGDYLEIMSTTNTLAEDTELSFEWAIDTDEASDSFKLVYTIVENGVNVQKVAAEIAGYNAWTPESVVLPKGAFGIRFENTRAGNVVGSGIVKIRNVEIHFSDADNNVQWVDYPEIWSESLVLKNLFVGRYNSAKFTARLIAEMPDGEKVYSQLRNFAVKEPSCVSPSGSNDFALDFYPQQTSVEVGGNFKIGESDGIRYGYILSRGAGEDELEYDVNIDGWDGYTDTSGKPATFTFTSRTPVKVTLKATIKGYWIYNYSSTSYCSAEISAPFDVSFNSRTGTVTYEREFPAGQNSFTITPHNNEGNLYSPYSLTVNLRFEKLAANVAKSIQSRLETIYLDSPNSTAVFSNLSPSTKYFVIPFIETNGNIFDQIPLFINLCVPSGPTRNYEFETLNGIPGTVTAETTQTSLSLSAVVDGGDGKIKEAGFRYALAGTTNYVEKVVEPNESGEIKFVLQRLKPDTQYSVESFVLLENCDSKAYSEPIVVSTKPIELNIALSLVTQSTIRYDLTVDCGTAELMECGLEDEKGSRYPFDGEVAEGKWHQTLTGLNVDSPYTFRAYAICASDPNKTFYSPSRNDRTKNVKIGTTKIVKIDENFNLVLEAEADLGDAKYETLKCLDNKLYYSGGNYVYDKWIETYDIELKDGKIITVLPGECVDKDKIYYTIKYAGKNPVKVGAETCLSTFNIQNTIQATSADFAFTPVVIPDAPEALSFRMSNAEHKNAVVTSEFTGSEYKVHLTGLNSGREFGLTAVCGERTVYKTLYTQEFKTPIPKFKFNIKTTQNTVTFTKENVNLYGATGGHFRIVLKLPGMKDAYKSAEMKWDEPCTIEGFSPYQQLRYFIYYYSAEGDPGISIIDDQTLTTSPITYPSIKAEPYQTAIVVDYDNTAFDSGDIEATEWGYQIGEYRVPAETGGGTIIFKYLNPGTQYDIYPYVKDAKGNFYTGVSYYASCVAHATTKPIVVRTGEATHISNNSAWLHGQVECDRYSDAKIGFEYKGSDETWEHHVFIPAIVDDDNNAITAFKPGFLDPEMGYYYRCVVEYPEGNIISDIAYNNPTSYSKRWKWFRTEKEFCYYEPGCYAVLRTDHATNSILLQGYIYYGSEDILSCGYYYWRTNGNEAVRNVPANAMKVKTDEDMVFNISEAGLPNGSYKIAPFVETFSGNFSGNELSFVIGASGVEDIEISSLTENVVAMDYGIRIDNADGQRAVIYDLSGRLIRMVDVYGNAMRVNDLPSRSLILVRLSSGAAFKIMTK